MSGNVRAAGGLSRIMNRREPERESLKKALPRLPWALGYSLTSTWATVLLFSSAFSTASTSAIVTTSMLSGVVACLATFFLHPKTSLFNGRCGASSLWATGMAVGTLMCTFPELASIGIVHDIGLVVSGFCAILLLLTWFEAFSRLSSRTIVFLGGCSFLISALGVFGVLALPVEAGSIAISALPVVSLSLLPRPSSSGEAPVSGKMPLSAIVSQAVSWKTLLGIGLSFFTIGAVGALAPNLGMGVELSALYLGIPTLLALVTVLTAWVCPRRLDASILFKLLLVGVAAIAFLLVYTGTTNLSLVFFLYISADVVLWTVLALAAKKTPVAPHSVFACGWLAECAGNVLGHNVAAALGGTPALFALVMLLVLVAVGFAFGDGMFVVELGEGEGEEGAGEGAGGVAGAAGTASAGERVGASASGSSARTGAMGAGERAGASAAGAAGTDAASHLAVTSTPEPAAPSRDAHAAAMDAFAARHGLSEREAEVFRLWVTGHGLKHIQNTLFISESTVKTHLRSIYRKCDTHNRAEIIELFEREG